MHIHVSLKDGSGNPVFVHDESDSTGFNQNLQYAVGGLAETMKEEVTGMGALATALTLALIYFYSMYGFSMLTGHITAMVAAFLALAVTAGAPAMLMVALLAYFSNLCGCLTNYSSGPVVIYSGFGYVPMGRWFKIGFIVSIFHLAVWLGVGLPYWKFLGWW